MVPGPEHVVAKTVEALRLADAPKSSGRTVVTHTSLPLIGQSSGVPNDVNILYRDRLTICGANLYFYIS